MTGLYLIGSAHKNRASKKKLEKIYEILKPEVLLSEVSEEEISLFNESLLPLLLKLPKDMPKEKIMEYVNSLRESYFGFEYSFNQAYARDHGIRNNCVDKFDLANAVGIKEGIEDLIRIINSGFDISEYLKKRKQKDKSQGELKKEFEAYTRLNGTEDLDKKLREPDNARQLERDICMEKKVRKLYDKTKTVVGVFGAVHTLDSPSGLTLYSKLRDLNPRVFLLTYRINYKNLSNN